MVNADHPAENGTTDLMTILFVHGFLDDSAIWNGVVSALEAPEIAVVQLDLPGMAGRPGEDGPFTLLRYAQDVTEALDAVDGPVVLVGQSMGSQVAELVSASRPGRVSGLVLLTPIPLAGSKLPAEAIAPFRDLGGRPEQQRGVRLQLSRAFPEKELERLVEAGAKVTPEATAEVVQSWNDGVPAGAEASAFAGPVLLVRGVADPFVSEEVVATGVAARFPGATTVAVEHAGHWPHAEQPEVVAGLLAAFLAHEVRGGAGEGNRAGGVREQGWTSAFAEKTRSAFADALAPEARLQATTLFAPVEGREGVQNVMAAASGIYESLVFTHEATSGLRTYLEWQATAFGGMALDGVTVLTKDAGGRIVDVAIHHRPLQAALAFSRELGIRLDGVVDRKHFYSGE